MSVDEYSGSFFYSLTSYLKELMSCSDKLSQAKGMFWATVLSNQQIRTCYNRIIIELGADAVPFFQSVIPGQFVMWI
jgi:hypothetical protein